jgi:hypothetical protein
VVLVAVAVVVPCPLVVVAWMVVEDAASLAAEEGSWAVELLQPPLEDHEPRRRQHVDQRAVLVDRRAWP